MTTAEGPDDRALEARCQLCGLVAGVGFVVDLPAMVSSHFADHHAELAAVVQGVHFTTYPPPFRCDICGAPTERPWWTWFTPATADYQVEDEGWLVCDECDPLVRRGDLLRLVKRNLDVTRRDAGLVASEPIRDRSIQSIRAFLEHIAGEPQRVLPGEPARG